MKVERQVERTEEEIAGTIPVYDVLVKALSYSRSGVDKIPLEEHPTIPSRIRSIFESTLEIYRYGRSSHSLLKKYAVYCLSIMMFLEGAEQNLCGPQQLLS